MGTHNIIMFLWRTGENYPIIVTKYYLTVPLKDDKFLLFMNQNIFLKSLWKIQFSGVLTENGFSEMVKMRTYMMF